MFSNKLTSSRRLFSNKVYTSSLNNYSPNTVSTIPKFHPKDNSHGTVDMANHSRQKWSKKEIEDASEDAQLYGWGATNFMRDRVVNVDRTEGIYLYDHDGKRYIDWCSGAMCSTLGHTMPDSIRKAITDQMDHNSFVYGDTCSSEVRTRLCALMKELSPGDINGFFFASGGAEANESAFNIARRFTGRPKIMSRYRSYHGGTPGALAATGDPRTWGVDSTQTGYVKMMDPFPFNWSWADDEEEAAAKCLGALHDQILYEGPHKIAGIILEMITGANGWMRMNTTFMQGVRALCDQYGILLISDEVMQGFGRSGKMFGFQHYEGVLPDMYTFAKGVSAAYLPFAGVGVRQEIFDHFKTNPLGMGSTYGGHPTPCAAAYATLKYNLEHDILGHVRDVAGPVMSEEIDKLVQKHPSAKAGRNYGLGAGIDLADKHGNFLFNMHEANAGMDQLRTDLREDGLITFARGHHLHCCPPLIITPQEIRESFEILDRAFTKLDKYILEH